MNIIDLSTLSHFFYPWDSVQECFFGNDQLGYWLPVANFDIFRFRRCFGVETPRFLGVSTRDFKEMVEVQLGEILNQGGFSVVHKGTWHGTKVRIQVESWKMQPLIPKKIRWRSIILILCYVCFVIIYVFQVKMLPNPIQWIGKQLIFHSLFPPLKVSWNVWCFRLHGSSKVHFPSNDSSHHHSWSQVGAHRWQWRNFLIPTSVTNYWQNSTTRCRNWKCWGTTASPWWCHPWKIHGWNLKNHPALKRKISVQTSIVGFKMLIFQGVAVA